MEQVLEYFKNVPFLQGLTSSLVLKMSKALDIKRMENGGKFILKEGDPVTHVALVKEGEFEVVKSSLRGMDDRLLDFLRKGDTRKKIAQKVQLLPGRTSVYQKTNLLVPVHERVHDNSFLHDKSINVEQMAFNQVSDDLIGIA